MGRGPEARRKIAVFQVGDDDGLGRDDCTTASRKNLNARSISTVKPAGFADRLDKEESIMLPKKLACVAGRMILSFKGTVGK